MKPATLWFTGLPCAGKTTLSTALAASLRATGQTVVLLDGDEVRESLSKDLGFDAASRHENVRRCGAVAELVTRSGAFTLVALVSPYISSREQVRARHREAGLRFLEVYLSASLAVCESRDPRGLYAKGRAGLARQVTGLDAPFEPPPSAELVVPAQEATTVSVQRLMELLRSRE